MGHQGAGHKDKLLTMGRHSLSEYCWYMDIIYYIHSGREGGGGSSISECVWNYWVEVIFRAKKVNHLHATFHFGIVDHIQHKRKSSFWRLKVTV